MTQSRNYTIAAGSAVAVVILALVLAALAPPAPVAAQNTACYRPQGGASFVCADGGSFIVGDGATLTVESGGTLDVNGASTLTGTVTTINVDVTGNLEVTDYIANSGQTYFVTGAAHTVTNGEIYTPLETVVELSAAGTVGFDLTAPSDGQWVTLINTAAQTITLSETTTIRSAGNFAMGQYDTIMLVGVGVKWYEVARSNN